MFYLNVSGDKKRSWHRREFLGAGFCALTSARAEDGPPSRVVEAKQAVVAAESEPGDAAASVLRAGGNAMDAAAAACLATCMVVPHLVDLGGYVAAAVVLEGKTGKVWAIDADSAAPAAATASMFRVLPKAPDVRDINENEYGCSIAGNANVDGALAIGVPGTLAGIGRLHEKFGRLKWAQVVAPAERLLSDGFRIRPDLAKAVTERGDVIRKMPAAAAHLIPNGRPLEPGEVWHRPEMQWTLRRIAKAGWQDFYRGETARRIVSHVRSLGGILTERDLARYEARCVPAIEVACGTSRLFAAPLPNGGLTTLSGALMLHELRAPGPDDPLYWHSLSEVLKIVWRDRLRWFGDPVQGGPEWRRFTAPDYIARSTDRLRRDPRSVDAAGPVPPRSSPGTMHVSVADREGNVVAITISHGGSFGSCVTVPHTGITLGHGMCRFDPHPGLPNSVGPGKRPLNNICPTLLRQPERDVAFGLRGGRRIVSASLSLAHQLILGRSLEATVREPRLHNEGYEPIQVTESMPVATRTVLEELGHRLTVVPALGGTANVAERARDRMLRAASNSSVIGVD